MANVAVIINGNDLGIDMHCNKMVCFSYKGGCGVCECTHIEKFQRRAGLGYR